MKNMRNGNNPQNAEEIAQLADEGSDVSGFFTGGGRMMPALPNTSLIQRVNVDFAMPMLTELDEAARSLNISRQAVIKSLLRQALDTQYVARSAALGSRPK